MSLYEISLKLRLYLYLSSFLCSKKVISTSCLWARRRNGEPPVKVCLKSVKGKTETVQDTGQI